MNKKHLITFKLDGASQDTMHMKRLAEYISVISAIYGKDHKIFLDSITKGSIDINSFSYDENIINCITNNFKKEITSKGSNFLKLNNMLIQDNFPKGRLIINGTIIAIVDPTEDKPNFKIKKKSNVQGILFSIGGKDLTINLRIQGANSEIYLGETNREIAKKLSSLLFQSVRVTGIGDWERIDTVWRLKKIVVTEFEKLSDEPLSVALKSLGSFEGNNWLKYDNTSDILDELRADE